MPGPRCAGGGVGSGCRPCAPSKHGGDAGHQGLFNLLGADEVDVGVDAPSGEDLAFSGDHLSTRANDQVHTRLNVGVAGFADGRDAPGLDADIGLHDAPMVEDQGIGDDGVHRLFAAELALSHAIANHLAAAEFDLFAVVGVVGLHPNPERGVAEAHPVPGGRAVHLRVGGAVNFGHRNRPPVGP